MVRHLTPEHKAALLGGLARRREADLKAMRDRLEAAGVLYELPPGWREQWKLPRKIQATLDEFEKTVELPEKAINSAAHRPRWKQKPKSAASKAQGDGVEPAPKPPNPPPPWAGRLAETHADVAGKAAPEAEAAGIKASPPDMPRAIDYTIGLSRLIAAVSRCAEELLAIRVSLARSLSSERGPPSPPPGPEDVLRQALAVAKGLGVETPVPDEDDFAAQLRAEMDELDAAPPAEAPQREVAAIWKKRMALWRSAKMWQAEWGPRPGQVGCAAPDELLLDSEVQR